MLVLALALALLEADFFVWVWGAEASMRVFVLVAVAVDGGAPFLSSDDSSFVLLLSELPLAAGRSPNKPPYMVKEYNVEKLVL